MVVVEVPGGGGWCWGARKRGHSGYGKCVCVWAMCRGLKREGGAVVP